MKLRPFGEGCTGHENGYDLPFLVGWLRGLADEESARDCSSRGPYAKRLAKVEDAIAILEPIAENEDEE